MTAGRKPPAARTIRRFLDATSSRPWRTCKTHYGGCNMERSRSSFRMASSFKLNAWNASVCSAVVAFEDCISLDVLKMLDRIVKSADNHENSEPQDRGIVLHQNT
jgi:hypothetical protein